MKDLTPIEAGRWMAAAPPLVQEAVTSSATQEVIDGIGKQYTLHIDVIGTIVKCTGYMLIGYAGPDEFLKELKAVGVSDLQAQQIVNDINKKIFVPLREKMQQSDTSVTQPAQPAVQPVPTPVSRRSEPVVASGTKVPMQGGGVKSYAPPLQSPKYFHLENKIAPAPRPPVSSFAPMPPKSALPRQTAATAPKPMDTGRLLEDHEEPHIEFAKAPARQASAETPLRQALRTVLPPANLPGATAPTPASPTPPIQPKVILPGFRASFVAPPKAAPLVPPTSPAQPMTAPRSVAPTPPAPASRPKPAPSAPAAAAPKAYVADPYREPIE